MNWTPIYEQHPSNKCPFAYEPEHDDMTSPRWSYCCDHAPLGPVERKSLHETMKRTFGPAPATFKRARGY